MIGSFVVALFLFCVVIRYSSFYFIFLPLVIGLGDSDSRTENWVVVRLEIFEIK